jgi:hypothetical protein
MNNWFVRGAGFDKIHEAWFENHVQQGLYFIDMRTN